MLPKLYGEFADWYTLLTPPEDYQEEAEWYANLLRKYAQRDVRTILELGCGSGANASYFKKWFDELVLVDVAESMLVECKKLNPELEQHLGDMRTFRIERRFDAVFIHDAISYIRTPEDLKAVVETAAAHLSPGGVVLMCPDDTRENFAPGTDDGGSDGPDGRGVRYLAWSAEGDDDNTVVTDYVYMLRDRDGTVRVEHDRHITGRLPEAAFEEALKSSGFSSARVALEHTEAEAERHHSFVGSLALA